MAVGSQASDVRRRPSRAHKDLAVRRLLAREIHDGVTQTLATILIQLANFRVEQRERGDVVTQLDFIETSLREATANLRELVYGLRGERVTSSRHFAELIADQLNEFMAKSGIEARLTVAEGWPSRLKTSAAVNLRRIVGEALVNVRRHSGARHLDVVLAVKDDALASIVIADDGRGVEPELLCQPGIGITAMRERARLLGGRLQIGSDDGVGTTIKVDVPLTVLARNRGTRPVVRSSRKLTPE